MIQSKDELIRDIKISGIKKQVAECINAAFSKGYETCFEQKKEIEDRAYQQGLEYGKRQGVAIDGDKRYWKGYHAAQEDGKKIYQKGLDDAWNMMKYICGGRERLLKVFGTISITKIITDNTASEAIEKIREYEEKQKQEEPQEIKIGDEVIYNGNAPHKGEKGFVIGLCGEWVEVRYLSSWNCVGVHIDTLTKTGRHFDGIEDALKQMRGEA